LITIEANLEPDKNWNDRLLQSKTGTFFQTKEFAWSKKLFGIEPVFLTFLENNGSIVGQMVGLIYPRYDKKRKFGKLLKSIPGTKKTLWRWDYGPVIFDTEKQLEIEEKLQEFLKAKKCRVWGSSHPFSKNSFSNFHKSFQTSSWATFILDLTEGRDFIWKNMDKHSTRKNIERSKSRNVTVKQMTINDLPIFFELVKKSEKSEQITPFSILEEQWKILQPVGYTGFIALEGEDPIGTIKVTSFNGYLYEFEVIRTQKDRIKKLYAQDLLKWNIIEWGIENNFMCYDLAGINPNPTTEKDMGIVRYKKKWGGNLVKYNLIKS